MNDKGVPITPEMAKKIEDSAFIVAGILLEKDGLFKLSGRQLFDVKGYRIELSAKLVSIPFPDHDKKDKQE